MNRRIGKLLQIGLFAALPMGWSGLALAQASDYGDKGINPEAGPTDIDKSLNKGTNMGTSGSSGSVNDLPDVGKPGSEFNGSPGGVKSDEIQRSSGSDIDN